MYSWDVAARVAAHFDVPWQESQRAREAGLLRLTSAISDPALPNGARLHVITEAVERMTPRKYEPHLKLYEDLTNALRARTAGKLDSLRAMLLDVAAAVASCDASIALAPGWAQGSEMEERMLERSILQATSALGRPDDVAACKGVVSAAVEHAALKVQLAAYARAETSATQAAVYTLAYAAETAFLSVRVVESCALMGPQGSID